MEEKEIEKKLKDDAEQVQTKDFSARWHTIQTKLSVEEICTEETVSVEELVTDTGNIQRKAYRPHKNRLNVALVSVLAFCLLTLAIVLPFTLRNKEVPTFFNERELGNRFVELDAFYAELNEANIGMIKLDDYEVGSTQLYLTPKEGLVVGGLIEFTDAENGYYVSMRFYADSVRLSSKYILGEYEEYRNISGIIIKYHVEEEDEIFTTRAELIFNNVTYRMECLSLESDILYLLDVLFK